MTMTTNTTTNTTNGSSGATPTTAKTRTERAARRRLATPRVDVYENEEELLLVADLPGVRAEDLDLRVEADTLTLRARRGDLDYERTFALPSGIDADKIEATLKSGTVHLHLPKTEAVKPRTIKVRTA